MKEQLDRIEQKLDELILNMARIEDTKIDIILKLLVEPEMKRRKMRKVRVKHST